MTVRPESISAVSVRPEGDEVADDDDGGGRGDEKAGSTIEFDAVPWEEVPVH